MMKVEVVAAGRDGQGLLNVLKTVYPSGEQRRYDVEYLDLDKVPANSYNIREAIMMTVDLLRRRRKIAELYVKELGIRPACLI
jgi:hypothetical protein